MLKFVFAMFKAFLTPFMWPLPQIASSVLLKGEEKRPILKARPLPNASDWFSSFGTSFRSYSITMVLVYGCYSNESYPAFGRAKTYQWQWIWPIIARNILATWLICGFWDWWLYFGPLKNRFFCFKIVEKYPPISQMKHDALFSTYSSILAALIEVYLCHSWASGLLPMVRSISEKPMLHMLLIPTIANWRIIHFWTIHRLIHPWRCRWLPDGGKCLYRHVHSLHHKSYNVTAFAGTNMHPVEAILYYSVPFMVIPFGVHPCLAIATIVDSAVAAWLGHDGHVFPAGAGSYYHTLHTLHFDCNYGSQKFPLDYWTNCFVESSSHFAKREKAK